MESKVATDEERPSVQDVAKQFSVFEDGAYAIQLQEELNVEHYQGNITRRRTVRSDVRVAKSQAEIEALKSFQVEHEIVERNREIEEKDKEAAREMHLKIKEEEDKAKEEEERDKEIAREMQIEEKDEYDRRKKTQLEREHLVESERLARSISQEDEDRIRKQKVTDSEDAMAALRISQEDERSRDAPAGLTVDVGGGGKVNGMPYVTDDAVLARQLQEHEKDKYLRAKKKKSMKDSERLAQRLQQEEKLKAERHRGQSPPFSDRDGRTTSPDEIRIRRVEDDEMIARQIHREEVQRAISEPEEDRLRREMHDADLARKMQHEEVVRAKSRRQRGEVGRVDPETGNSEDRGRHHEDRRHRHEPGSGHQLDPERGHRHDPERGHRHDPERGHRHDPERSHRPDLESGHRSDSGSGHRPDSGSGHRPDHESGHRPDHERGHRADSDRIHRYDTDRRQGPGHDHRESRQIDERPTSGRGGGVDPRLLERNPMVDAYPSQGPSSHRERPTGHIQPIPGQKRQTTKEREKVKEKEKKSKGLFSSKSKKK